jgi:hypothetical protein
VISNSRDREIRSSKKMELQVNSQYVNIVEETEFNLRTEYRKLLMARNRYNPSDKDYYRLQEEYVQNHNEYKTVIAEHKTLEKRLEQWKLYDQGNGPKPHLYGIESKKPNNYDEDTIMSGSVEVVGDPTNPPPTIEFVPQSNQEGKEDKISHSIGMANDREKSSKHNNSSEANKKESIGMPIEIHNGVYMYEDVEIHFRHLNPSSNLTKAQKRRKKRKEANLSLRHQKDLLEKGVIKKMYVQTTVKVIDTVKEKEKEYTGTVHCVGSSLGYNFSVVDSNAHKVVSSSMPAWRIALMGTEVDLIMNSNRLVDVITRNHNDLYKIPIGRHSDDLEE